MKILLINNNPVVSRLTALSARKEDIEIDEVQEVTELTSYSYDIVFVDADSWNKDVKSTIFEHVETKKRVLFYAQDDNEDLDLFDKGILKPFLPSEVSAVIRSVEEINTLDNITNEIEEEKSMNLVEDAKDNSKELLVAGAASVTGMAAANLDLDESKIDLMDELTKVDEEKVEETLLSSADLEDDLFKDSSEKLNINVNDFASKSSKEELFDLDLDDSKVSLDDDLFASDVKTTEKALDDEMLELDLEKEEELTLEEVAMPKEEELLAELKASKEKIVPELETKVLDVEEIETIKEILEDDTSSDTMELDDLLAPSMAGVAGVAAVSLSSSDLEAKDIKDEDADTKKKKKSKKEKKVLVEDSESLDTLVHTLSNLKVESLRELLAGATVSIKIEFPKA